MRIEPHDPMRIEIRLNKMLKIPYFSDIHTRLDVNLDNKQKKLLRQVHLSLISYKTPEEYISYLDGIRSQFAVRYVIYTHIAPLIKCICEFPTGQKAIIWNNIVSYISNSKHPCMNNTLKYIGNILYYTCMDKNEYDLLEHDLIYKISLLKGNHMNSKEMLRSRALKHKLKQLRMYRLFSNALISFDDIWESHKKASEQMFDQNLKDQILDNYFKPLDSKMHALHKMKSVRIQNTLTREVMEFMSRADFKKHFKISDRMYARFVKGERVKCLSGWKLMN